MGKYLQNAKAHGWPRKQKRPRQREPAGPVQRQTEGLRAIRSRLGRPDHPQWIPRSRQGGCSARQALQTSGTELVRLKAVNLPLRHSFHLSAAYQATPATPIMPTETRTIWMAVSITSTPPALSTPIPTTPTFRAKKNPPTMRKAGVHIDGRHQERWGEAAKKDATDPDERRHPHCSIWHQFGMNIVSLVPPWEKIDVSSWRAARAFATPFGGRDNGAPSDLVLLKAPSARAPSSSCPEAPRSC